MLIGHLCLQEDEEVLKIQIEPKVPNVANDKRFLKITAQKEA